LGTAGANGETQERGEITVRIWTEETVQASAGAVAGARQAVEDKLEDDSSPAKSLEAVVSKLKVFVDIVDEAAKVWKLARVIEHWLTLSLCRYTHTSILYGKQFHLCTKCGLHQFFRISL
jgi:hypothetical protein